MLSKSVTCFLLLLVSSSCQAQSNVPVNAQPTIAPHLQNCYRNRAIFTRDNRLPMTPEILIELIRRVEDMPAFTMNIQQFTTSLLHRFKQDGIIPASLGGNINQQDVLQYNTRGFNFWKHRVLLTRLIPGNGNQFPNVNGTLSEEEQCALHFMLSSSIETQVRGDEGTVCGRLAQYRSVRVPRDTEDVEMMKTPELANVRKRMLSKFGRYQNDEEEPQPAEDEAEQPEEENEDAPEEQEGEEELTDIGEQNVGVVDVSSNAISQCPVENGVVQSPWGAFAAGTVIAGIAAGVERQSVTVDDLMGGSRFGQYKMARQTAVPLVDNRFAATLSGDIAESVLLQVPATPVTVGAPGVWNNSAVPRWFFLSQRERLEMTDAEIRGGIDGLVMGTNIPTWRSAAQNLRLSQVLDMYFSQRGIFGRTNVETAVRACNRRNLFSVVAPIERLREQSFAFTTVLDGEMQTHVTLSANSTRRFSEQASEALNTYVANMNDVSCVATQTIPNDDTIWRTATDILIFVEFGNGFNHRELQTMIGHLLNNLDVGRFGSSYTILNANDGQIVVNTTNRLTNLYSQWTPAAHSNQPLGLNLPNILSAARTHAQNMMNNERLTVSTGGRSHIALIVAQQTAVNEEHTNFAVEQLQIFREDIPDLRFIYWAAGSFERFNRFVRDPARDTFPLRIDLQGIGGDSIQAVAFPVLHRIQQEPRRIINHRCGADWNPEGQNQGTTLSIQFVEPRGIVFYRLHPNYFFRPGGDRRIRIHGAGYSSITVCQSRSVERPRANNTSSQQQNNDVECQNVNTDTVEINLSNACDGHGVIHTCSPLFISIEGARSHDGTNLRCNERECRFPDNARFEIIADNLGCFSSVANVAASIVLVLASIILTIRF